MNMKRIVPIFYPLWERAGRRTLIFRLAEEFKKQGLRVLIVTTTKMYVPDRFHMYPGEEGRERKTEEKIRLQLLREGIAVTGRTEVGTHPEKFLEVPGRISGAPFTAV